MNGWKIMRKELYIGGGEVDSITTNDPSLSVSSDMEILTKGDYTLKYTKSDSSLKLVKVVGIPLTLWSKVIPVGTELKDLMLNPNNYKTIQGTGSNFTNWIANESTIAYSVLLTSYGDLIVIHDKRYPEDSKIFWSALRSFLISKGYVNPLKPNYGDSFGFSLIINGKKFSTYDKTTWAYNIFATLPYKESGRAGTILNVNSFIWNKIGDRYWYMALYLTNNDLQMCVYNESKLSANADPEEDRVTNTATVMWRLSDILKKLGDTTSLVGIQYLTLKNGNLILSGGGTSIIYTLATGVDSTSQIRANTIGDLILTNSSDTIIWSFYSWLTQKILQQEAAAANKIKQELNDRITKAGDTKSLVDPVLTDKNKLYKLSILSAEYTCDTQKFNILGWLSKFLKDNVKTTDDLGVNKGINKNTKIWEATYADFGCASSKKPSMKIKWSFNGKEKETTFKDRENVVLTFNTPCVGGYGVCKNNKQKWEKTYDPFPSGSCDVKGDLSCVTATPPTPSPSPSPSPSPTPDLPPPPAEPDVNCVGEWSEFGECKDGEKFKTYKVTTPASGNGTCEAIDGQKETEECSNPWYKNPLILGGIAGGVFLLIIMIMMFTMGGSSPAPAV
jgi:hypothetical protein